MTTCLTDARVTDHTCEGWAGHGARLCNKSRFPAGLDEDSGWPSVPSRSSGRPSMASSEGPQRNGDCGSVETLDRLSPPLIFFL